MRSARGCAILNTHARRMLLAFGSHRKDELAHDAVAGLTLLSALVLAAPPAEEAKPRGRSFQPDPSWKRLGRASGSTPRAAA